MEKKHWYYIIVCSLVITICSILYMNYYKEYVAPKSYTIGSFKPRDYTVLEIKEQLTPEDVLFSHDFDNVSFKVDESTNIATYEFSSSPIEFNGENNDYVIYVNNYIVSNLDVTAGAISGTHTIKYYDVDKSVLATSTLNLSFASYTKNLLFKITLPADDIGLLMRYFEVNDFIVTLALNPFVEEKPVLYTVEFIFNDNVISTQSVEIGKYAVLPDIEEGYSWYIDDILVDVETTPILGDTTFIAKHVALMNGVFSAKTYTIIVENEELVSWENSGSIINFTKSFDGTYWKNYDGVSFQIERYDFDMDCWIMNVYNYIGEETKTTYFLTRQTDMGVE